ncbi:hypothetical protein PHMEG_00021270 [Phytophthora megakarya]|uniref:Uncharacterized protein n=1 Tax=Phytophthora megakarya TaxID=4795 RepID=A0A225VN69_9STRA|nr:hypothetical protein PHMEG_00021270 [Phytophthora megakarya]
MGLGFSKLMAQRMLSMVLEAMIGSPVEGHNLRGRALVVHCDVLDRDLGHEVELVGVLDLRGLTYSDTMRPEICTVPDSKNLGRLNSSCTAMSGTP